MSVVTCYRQALCAFVLSLWTLHACAGTPHDALQRRLDRIVPGVLAQQRIPSVSVAHIDHGRLALAAAWGEAAPAAPATPATLYNIASMTKPISAETVLRLVARGRVSLDAPMAPVWTDPDIADDPRRERLTPRLSLSHRTGFPNWRDDDGGRLRFLRAPGEAFGYSGEGFEYLRRYVETKTGRPLDALAGALVFSPAGMRETAYTRQPWFDGRMALPYDDDGAPLPPQIATHALASDDVWSTPRDYARFLIALMRRQGMPASLAEERMRIQTDRRTELCASPRVTRCPDDAGFGLGWEVFRFGKRRYLMHTGMDAGTFTLGYFSPDTGRGTVIFTNSRHGPQAVLPILDAIGEDRKFVAFLRALAG